MSESETRDGGEPVTATVERIRGPRFRILDSAVGGLYQLWAYRSMARFEAHAAVLAYLAAGGERARAGKVVEVLTNIGKEGFVHFAQIGFGRFLIYAGADAFRLADPPRLAAARWRGLTTGCAAELV